MVDSIITTAAVRSSPEAKSPAALTRVITAKKRIQSILDREIVANQKTLEQKISDQGPVSQRVDPHLLGLAIKAMLELRQLRTTNHSATKTTPWYSNLLTSDDKIAQRLDDLAPLYGHVSGSAFSNLTGDALEVITFKCLREINASQRQYVYQGYFHLGAPKDEHGRYRKTQPPKTTGEYSTTKEADFLQFGYQQGGLCIECKNYREWLYPHHGIIRELIIKSDGLGLIPVLIARRVHYTTITNLFEPAGIVAHEAYHQYYPSEYTQLAEKVRNRRSLGFTDVIATENPQPRTAKFFHLTLPKIVPYMADRWHRNRESLVAYATNEINLAQLYTEIGSPAGGKWQDFETEQPRDSESDFF